MKHKVSELEGALLDAAVAKAQGRPSTTWLEAGGRRVPDAFSTDWDYGGPLIERERIELADGGPAHGGRLWWANLFTDRTNGKTGATPLIAATRAYVASKFGDEVELP